MGILIVLAALVVFASFWSGVAYLIARMGGWHRLAEFFETTLPPDPEGRSFRFQSSRLGMSNYNGMLHVHVQPDGLRLSVFAPFRPGHPPLLIPWDEIARIERKSSWGFKVFAMTIGDPELVTMTVPKTVVRAIREMLPAATVADASERDAEEDLLNDGRWPRRRTR